MIRTLILTTGLMFATLSQDTPTHDLTMREVIETVADFDVLHREQQPFFPPAFGVTHFETNPPSIWLFNTGTLADRRSTVIHELLHVHYRALHLNPPEEFIAAEENRLYEKWFLKNE